MTETAEARRTTPRHPIAVVTQRTGLSQDLLRVWERRYRAVAPARGPGGQRLYSDADIERLALLHAATLAGRSISRVAGLADQALAELVDEDVEARERRSALPDGSGEKRDLVGEALFLARALDAAALDDTLRRAIAVMGVSAFIESVAAPLLRRVGSEWHAGRLSMAHEHMVSSLLHDIVAERMRAFGRRADAPRMVVATLAGERHAIGAVLAGAAAAVEGWNVLHLGADLPAAAIAEAARSADARVVAVSIVFVEDREALLEELRALRTTLPATVTLVAGGGGAAGIAGELSAIGVRVETSVNGLLGELRRVEAAA
jgi:DNA-binding transcriptional MerR regulator/methylmalonyl-CoA mutase cobalamin-binding subunit